MLKKIKKKIFDLDRFLFKKFGSDRTIKFLENIKEAQIIFSHLNKTGEESQVRFVGGCVRKSLSGEIVDDIDLATSLSPEEVKEKLIKKQIKVLDTGIEHGTVTAIINNKKFEITTLREDVSTDGRHANVQFNKNWNSDSLRRDFTINAIYADIEGRIFDPLNGIVDLKNGKIKFIGSPEKRIQEDYLRILRYFRFFIQYSNIEHDHEVIRCIKRNINGINKISNERIFEELNKIFKLKNFYDIFFNKDSKEIFLNIFPSFKFYERLKILKKFNKNIKQKYDSTLILSLLIIDDSDSYEYFCHKYKTSNQVKKRFKIISKNYENLKSKKFYNREYIKKLIYSLNKKEHVVDLLLFSACINKKIKISDIEELIKYIMYCKIPKFPISGEFLKQYGYVPGEALGKKLKFLEEKWIQNNFIIDKNIIEKTLGKPK